MFKIERFDSVTSTNDIAAQRANEGAKEGIVILASSQTNGRGRMGRNFVSEKNCGIYMSVLLRPAFSPENSLLITTAAAVAVSETVEKYTGKSAQIKWVNDVYLDGKKVCGILTEGRISGDKLEYAILGIGLNLTEPVGGFDESIKDIAGAIFRCGEAFDREKIVSDILANFEKYYRILKAKPHFDGYVSRNMLLQREVDIIRGGETVGEGKVIGIAEDFSLEVLTDSGKINL
ncbi:MAG: biotin--[Clostridia bacterium]|nr:biotin--[acetyl-CoA-carboxylase] ligase [Clostridia bacterium]